ncbi:MAG TPA: SIS domain-containing protein [Candidatus Baltobacteraceae bacterium]|jgi:D-sedoheptulose 7-phosphate isomerase
MLRSSSLDLRPFVLDRIDARTRASQAFFPGQARPLAVATRKMAERFRQGGRLLAFGKGPYATDAQHVSVEFQHPVLVGKRALPALDVSMAFRDWIAAIAGPHDMAMGFGPPRGDPEIAEALRDAAARGVMTFAMPGNDGDYAVAAPSADAHVHQELIELLCHALYESVHVFLEHRESGHDVGASTFLYPFLGKEQQPLDEVVEDVSRSILEKTRDAQRLREGIVAGEGVDRIVRAAIAIRERLDAGGKLLIFGNGGSATDATDWALDCVLPDDGMVPIPAISLALEPACITAIANDVGTEVIFLRQLIAQAASADVAIALSTSGGSKNVILALEEARKRGLLTIALLGYDGGEIARRSLVDHAIVADCDYIPRIQEVQATIYHIMRELLDRLRAHAA